MILTGSDVRRTLQTWRRTTPSIVCEHVHCTPTHLFQMNARKLECHGRRFLTLVPNVKDSAICVAGHEVPVISWVDGFHDFPRRRMHAFSKTGSWHSQGFCGLYAKEVFATSHL